MWSKRVPTDKNVLAEKLYSESVSPEVYGASYSADHLGLYNLYVEMTDRISQRRGVANSFFATLNTTLVSVGVSVSDPWQDGIWIVPLVGLGLCVVWIVLLRAYRLLNDAKFEVIGILENRLPLALYKAEWVALGEGEDRTKYQRLTVVETVVPSIFGIVYAGIAIYVLILQFGP